MVLVYSTLLGNLSTASAVLPLMLIAAMFLYTGQRATNVITWITRRSVGATESIVENG
jgi:hypothetical protein